MKKILSISLFLLFLMPLAVQAKTLKGIVRNVRIEKSRSFGLDEVRVYVNSGTKFSNSSFESLKVGDKVKVKGSDMQPGTFIATSVKVVGHVEEERDLSKNTLKVELGSRFLMGPGQKAVLKAPGRPALEIKAKEFINTLCKGGYDCSGDGYVGMLLEVRAGGEKNEVWLRSQGHRKPTSPVKARVETYEIQLVEAGEDVVLLVVR